MNIDQINSRLQKLRGIHDQEIGCRVGELKDIFLDFRATIEAYEELFIESQNQARKSMGPLVAAVIDLCESIARQCPEGSEIQTQLDEAIKNLNLDACKAGIALK